MPLQHKFHPTEHRSKTYPLHKPHYNKQGCHIQSIQDEPSSNTPQDNFHMLTVPHLTLDPYWSFVHNSNPTVPDSRKDLVHKSQHNISRCYTLGSCAGIYRIQILQYRNHEHNVGRHTQHN